MWCVRLKGPEASPIPPPLARSAPHFRLDFLPQVLPYAIVVQAFVGMFVDPPGLWAYTLTTSKALWIAVSGVAAFLVNLSGFMVIGNLGGLTHVLLGQGKTAAICLGAWLFLGSTYSATQLGGAAIAIGGITAYTHATISERDTGTRG